MSFHVAAGIRPLRHNHISIMHTESTASVQGIYTFEVKDAETGAVKRSYQQHNALSYSALAMMLHGSSYWAYLQRQSTIPLTSNVAYTFPSRIDTVLFNRSVNYTSDSPNLVNPVGTYAAKVLTYPSKVKLLSTVPEGEEITLRSVCQKPNMPLRFGQIINMCNSTSNERCVPLVRFNNDTDGLMLIGSNQGYFMDGELFVRSYGISRETIWQAAVYFSESEVYAVCVRTILKSTSWTLYFFANNASSPIGQITVDLDGKAWATTANVESPHVIIRPDLNMLEIWCCMNDGTVRRGRGSLDALHTLTMPDWTWDTVSLAGGAAIPLAYNTSTQYIGGYYDKKEQCYWLATAYPAALSVATSIRKFKEEEDGILTPYPDTFSIGMESAIIPHAVRLDPDEMSVVGWQLPVETGNIVVNGRRNSLFSYTNLSAPVVKAADETLSISYELKIVNQP